MMKLRLFIPIILVIFSALALARPGSSSMNNDVIVNNADSVSGISVTYSQGLVDSTVGFGPHLGVQFANSNHTYLFSAAPAALQTLFGQVTDRVTFEFANSSREVGLTAVSAALDTLFDQVTDRVVFEFANSSRSYALNFPVAIINDTTSPQVTNISVTPVGSDMVEISWTTDEFANSLVKFGTSSGNYTKTISDPLYVKVHQVTLTGINAGTTYYYRVSGTDLSGNVVQSGEFSFTAETSIYLPAIMR
ncbi:MAG: hypothetical protein GY796_34985 [Chloroflexi bacterium]|nr:hypothetical protein [Chloroflexota bacterium]